MSTFDWLQSLKSEAQFFREGRPPSLEPTSKVLEALGKPDKSFKYRVVVGGTAGKGSVCRQVEQTLLNQGKTVATLSSPELQVLNERIRLNGKLVTNKTLAQALATVQQACSKHYITLTFYEVVVVAGIYLAAKQGIEILICEVGLGGEFDAVNAVQGPRIAALTFVGDDHREILGPKRTDIARTKAGIFTNDSVLNLTYEQKYSSILEIIAINKIVYIKGIKQKLNKKLARKICEQILCSKNFEMPHTKLPARWECMPTDQPTKGSTEPPKVILDGSHSAPRFEYLKQTKLKRQPGPYTLVLGMQQNHNLEAFKIILPYATRVIWTESGREGACAATKLQKYFKLGEVIPDPLKALNQALKFSEPVLVTGSFYLCGQIREHYYPAKKILEQQTEWPE